MSSTFQTASSENINFTKLFLIPANGEDAAGLAGVTTECREGRKTRNQCRGAPLGVRGPVAAVRRTCAGARARKRRAVWRPAVRGKLPPARTARRWVPASGSRPPGGLFVPSILTGWAAGMFKKSGRGNDSYRPSHQQDGRLLRQLNSQSRGRVQSQGGHQVQVDETGGAMLRAPFGSRSRSVKPSGRVKVEGERETIRVGRSLASGGVAVSRVWLKRLIPGHIPSSETGTAQRVLPAFDTCPLRA